MDLRHVRNMTDAPMKLKNEMVLWRDTFRVADVRT